MRKKPIAIAFRTFKSLTVAMLVAWLSSITSLAASDNSSAANSAGTADSQALAIEEKPDWKQLHDAAEKALDDNNYSEAATFIDRCMDEVRARGYGWTDIHTRNSYMLLNRLRAVALSLQQQGKDEQAELVFKDSIRILDKIVTNDAATSAALCGATYSRNADQPTNYELYQKVLEMQKKPREGQSAEKLSNHTIQCRADIARLNGNLRDLGRLYQSLRRYTEAETAFCKNLEVAEAWHESFTTTYVLNLLADLYLEQGKYADAERVLKRSISLRWKGDPYLPETTSKLAQVYALQGKGMNAKFTRLKAGRIKASQEADAQTRAWVLGKVMQFLRE